jgi:hypothetical protein
VIRFSAFLVAVAVALLVAGVVTSKLALVYVAIGVSGVALLALGVGALVKRKELFGAPSSAEQEPAGPQQVRPDPATMHVSPGQPVPWEASVPVASAWPATAEQSAPSRAGYLPADRPAPPQPQPQPVPPPVPPHLRPAERPADVPRRPAAFAPRPPADPAPGAPAPGLGAWDWHPDAPETREIPRITAASAPPSAPPSTAPPPAAEPSGASESRPAPQDEPLTVRFDPAQLAAQNQPAALDDQPAVLDDQPAALDDQPSAPDLPGAQDEPAAQAEQPAETDEPAETAETAETDEPAPPADRQPPAEDHEAEDQQDAEEQPQDQPSAEATQQVRVVASPTTEPAPDAPEPAAPEPEPEPATATSEAPATSEDPDTPEPAAVDLEREVTVVPGVPRYHHPHCLLIRFMGEGDLAKMTLGAARDSGCTPCRACLPDQPEGSSELGSPEPERQGEIAHDVLPPLHPARTRPGVDRQHLVGDQPRVLGQGRRHLRVI